VQYPDYKPALESPPLSDVELQALDTLLLGLERAAARRQAAADASGAAASAEAAGDGVMNIEMLDGYLTALLLAPKPVTQLRGADWLPAVWGGDGADDAPFASGKQKKRAIVLVLRHLHAVDEVLRRQPERWEPVFSVAETDDSEWVDAEDWCIGFLQAAAMDGEGWGRLFDDPELGPLLLPIGLLGGDDSQLPPADAERLQEPAHRDELSRRVPDAVLALCRRPGRDAG
jgi:uncharacterized protein